MTDYQFVDHLEICCDKLYELGLDRIQADERIAALVSIIDCEVPLGGLRGFFDNSSGEYAVETVDALRAIGAMDAAEAIERAIRLFPDMALIRDQEYRQSQTGALVNAFREIEKQYEDQTPCTFDLLRDYVEARF